MTSKPIDAPGTIYSACGKYGCGDHGTCGTNNMCECQPGWTGVHCEVAPITRPDASLGDSECGNWGVYGELTLGAPGLAPNCDCSDTGGMKGERCERECDDDADCAHGGTCDQFGRCNCATRCFVDTDCDLGVCDLATRTCTDGWTDVGCRRALSDVCASDGDCSDHGACINNKCACELDYTGMRCEFQLAGSGESCTYNTDCRDYYTPDKCLDDGTCEHSGAACGQDVHCRAVCRDGVCAFQGNAPAMSDQDLDDKLLAMMEELATPEGMAMLLAEEGVEYILGKYALLFSLIKGGAAGAARMSAGIVRMSTRNIYKTVKTLNRIAGVAGAGYSRTLASRGTSAMFAVMQKDLMPRALKNLSFHVHRMATSKAVKKFAAQSMKVYGYLYFIVQAIGMVLDLVDHAGYNTQLNQDFVDQSMKKMMQALNEDPVLREAGIQYPLEFLPDNTLEWRVRFAGDVAEVQRVGLVQDYIERLNVNSNGATIKRSWEPLAQQQAALDEEVAAKRNSTVWKLAGENQNVYDALMKWWWLILVLVVVILVAVGLGIGLSARASKPGVKNYGTSPPTV